MRNLKCFENENFTRSSSIIFPDSGKLHKKIPDEELFRQGLISLKRGVVLIEFIF